LLDIEHRQLGPRAVVVFRDSGVFDTRDVRSEAIQIGTGQKPAPGAKTAKPMLGAREQIGMRDFLIDLPTGAPHRADEAAIDVAQAQQCARDLSALMTRAPQERSGRQRRGAAQLSPHETGRKASLGWRRPERDFTREG